MVECNLIKIHRFLLFLSPFLNFTLLSLSLSLSLYRHKREIRITLRSIKGLQRRGAILWQVVESTKIRESILQGRIRSRARLPSFRTKRNSCGGGIGSNVRSRFEQRKKKYIYIYICHSFRGGEIKEKRTRKGGEILPTVDRKKGRK